MKIHSRMIARLLVCLVAPPVFATPLPVGDFADGKDALKPWPLSAGGSYELAPDATTSVTVAMPPLNEKDIKAGGEWLGVFSVDLFGMAAAGKHGSITVEAVDPTTDALLASGSAKVDHTAPRSPWVVMASSEHPGAEAANAFDGNPKTDWHSNYAGRKAAAPHWIGLEFGSPTRMTGLIYMPRQGGFTNGVARKYRVEIRRGDGDWEAIAAGETDQRVSADRAPLEVSFPKPMDVDAFRFIIDSDWSGGGFGTAGEIEVPGVKLDHVPPVSATSRAWVAIPPDIMKLHREKSLSLRVRNGSQSAIVIGTPRFARVNTAPSGKLFGRSNGGLGPDKLGAGLLGFDALTEHQQTVLSIMNVRPGGTAASHGLRQGDVIVAVRGRPLPMNDLKPGWSWFHDSHEAVIGRETEAALQAGETTLALSVLRNSGWETLAIPLDRKAAFTTMDAATDPEAARMLADSIAHLIRTQRDDGSGTPFESVSFHYL